MVHASLFSGIGGPEVAAAMLGWKNAFHCEINPFGRKVLEYWFPESVSYEDITKTNFTEWRGRIDVLTGGFPCQPFSYAGKRGGQKDNRYLWPEMLRVVDEIRPTWVIGENVAGILTMGEGWLLRYLGCDTTLFPENNQIHNWLLNQSVTIDKVAKDLEGLGYSVQPVLIPAAAVGAPHRRDRIFILAHVADSNGNRRDMRVSRKNEGKSKKERVQKRDQVQRIRESNNVRHTFEETTTDTHGSGSGKVHTSVQAGFDNGRKPVSNGGEQYATDTYNKRFSITVQPGSHGAKEWEGTQGPTFKHSNDAWIKGTWWDSFPTVSPVFRGNYGLPFDVDDLTISLEKWRKESLKAYGNAIVPQVMYEIFRAIESVESIKGI